MRTQPPVGGEQTFPISFNTERITPHESMIVTTRVCLIRIRFLMLFGVFVKVQHLLLGKVTSCRNDYIKN